MLDALRARPHVLVVEDLHWADEATLDLVRFLARRIATLPLLLVLSYRDAVGVDHPAARRCSATSSPRPTRCRLQLAPLSRGGRRRRCSTGTRLDPVDIHRRTAGNPFFVSQILAQPDSPLPASVRDAVVARIAGAGPAEARRHLELLSCTPEPVGGALLARLGVPSATVGAARRHRADRPQRATAWRSGTRSPVRRSSARPHPARSRRCTRR